MYLPRSYLTPCWTLPAADAQFHDGKQYLPNATSTATGRRADDTAPLDHRVSLSRGSRAAARGVDAVIQEAFRGDAHDAGALLDSLKSMLRACLDALTR